MENISLTPEERGRLFKVIEGNQDPVAAILIKQEQLSFENQQLWKLAESLKNQRDELAESLRQSIKQTDEAINELKKYVG